MTSLYGPITPPVSPRENLLLDHLAESIEKAKAGISKINEDEFILQLPGMSSPRVRHLLNQLCSLPATNYLEIGLWRGATFVSALFENEKSVHSAIGIDNWCRWAGALGSEQHCRYNCSLFIPQKIYQIHTEDSFSIQKETLFKKPINVYFYDGTHTEEAQEMAFTFYNEILDDLFIAVIDDWEWERVQKGTFSAFKKLGYKILYERHLSNKEAWWNGLYVALVKK